VNVRWRTTTLGDACPISSRKAEEFEGERPYYATGSVGALGQLLGKPELVTFAERPSRAGCMPKAGDVGFARMKGTKKVIRIDEALDGALFSTGFCFLAPSAGVDPDFVFYFIASDEFQRRKDAAAGAGIMGGLRNADASRIPIKLPSLPEQQRIVGILDRAFEGIATAKANTEKNVQNTRALFDSYRRRVFAERDSGWEERRLADVSVDFGRGRSRHRPRNAKKLYGGSYPFIQTGDVRNAKHVITAYSQTYSEEGLAQSKLWPKGTLCITIAANIAETGILGFDACFPDSIIGMVVDDSRAEVKYVEYLLQSYKVLLQAQGKGSAQDNINLGTFENQTFPFPDLQAQQAIVRKLDQLRRETERLEHIYEEKSSALNAMEEAVLHRATSWGVR